MALHNPLIRLPGSPRIAALFRRWRPQGRLLRKGAVVPGIIVVGSQWGDEGKGKVVDVFSAQADFVVRYQGGANAGHTLVVNGVKTVLHLVPSGVLHPKTTCVIAAGVVLDLEEVASEVSALRAAGLLQNPEQLRISDSATVLLSYHRALDAAREKALGQEKIGTTGRGIGPAYEDRASRKAILFGDLFERATLKEKLRQSLLEKNSRSTRFSTACWSWPRSWRPTAARTPRFWCIERCAAGAKSCSRALKARCWTFCMAPIPT
jgi:hypothetical protein